MADRYQQANNGRGLDLPKWNQAMVPSSSIPSQAQNATGGIDTANGNPQVFGTARRVGPAPVAGIPAPTPRRLLPHDSNEMVSSAMQQLPNANDTSYWVGRARTFEAAGRYEEANAIFEQGIKRVLPNAAELTRAHEEFLQRVPAPSAQQQHAYQQQPPSTPLVLATRMAQLGGVGSPAPTPGGGLLSSALAGTPVQHYHTPRRLYVTGSAVRIPVRPEDRPAAPSAAPPVASAAAGGRPATPRTASRLSRLHSTGRPAAPASRLPTPRRTGAPRAAPGPAAAAAHMAPPPATTSRLQQAFSRMQVATPVAQPQQQQAAEAHAPHQQQAAEAHPQQQQATPQFAGAPPPAAGDASAAAVQKAGPEPPSALVANRLAARFEALGLGGDSTAPAASGVEAAAAPMATTAFLRRVQSSEVGQQQQHAYDSPEILGYRERQTAAAGAAAGTHHEPRQPAATTQVPQERCCHGHHHRNQHEGQQQQQHGREAGEHSGCDASSPKNVLQPSHGPNSSLVHVTPAPARKTHEAPPPSTGMMTRSKARSTAKAAPAARGGSISSRELSPTEANIRMQLRSASKGGPTRRKSLTATCPVCPH